MTLRFRAVSTDDERPRRLLEEYFTSRELGFAGAAGYTIVPPDPARFTPPRGVFLLVIATDLEPSEIGCGGVRSLSDGRFELKHLWVQPRARGRGVGRALLAELERRAIELGADELVLDTNSTLEAADALYRSSGYIETPPYNDNPNATTWFSKPVSTAGG